MQNAAQTPAASPVNAVKVPVPKPKVVAAPAPKSKSRNGKREQNSTYQEEELLANGEGPDEAMARHLLDQMMWRDASEERQVQDSDAFFDYGN